MTFLFCVYLWSGLAWNEISSKLWSLNFSKQTTTNKENPSLMKLQFNAFECRIHLIYHNLPLIQRTFCILCSGNGCVLNNIVCTQIWLALQYFVWPINSLHLYPETFDEKILSKNDLKSWPLCTALIVYKIWWSHPCLECLGPAPENKGEKKSKIVRRAAQ